ncbi:MAG: bile acid:sodium symporter [Myxococcota bacterium]
MRRNAIVPAPGGAVDIALVLKVAPVLLALMMLGMGMGLVPDDFRRVLAQPRAAAAGLFGQMVLLPALGFALAALFPLSPEIAAGVAILAISPGGPGSNLVALLAKADAALSVSLTAVNSLLAIVTVPLLTAVVTTVFLGESHTPPPSALAKIGVGVCVLTLVPVALGMAVRRWRPTWADRADRPVRLGSFLLLLLLVIGVAIEEGDHLVGHLQQAGPVDVVLCAGAMAVGFGMARLAGLPQAQQRTLLIEVGVQNGALALLVTELLGNTAMAVPVLVYSPVMLTASLGVVAATTLLDSADHP